MTLRIVGAVLIGALSTPGLAWGDGGGGGGAREFAGPLRPTEVVGVPLSRSEASPTCRCMMAEPHDATPDKSSASSKPPEGGERATGRGHVEEHH